MLRRNLPSIFPLLAVVGMILGILRSGGEFSTGNTAIMIIGATVLGFVAGRFPLWTKFLGESAVSTEAPT